MNMICENFENYEILFLLYLFRKKHLTKLGRLSVPNLDLIEKIGKVVIK